MLRQLLRVMVILLVSVVTQWSCRTEQDTVIYPIEPSISVDEARHWFDGQRAGARAGANEPADRMAYWKYAKNDKLPNGVAVVAVPLLYGYNESFLIGERDYTIRPGKPARAKVTKADTRIQKKLIVARDAGGLYHSCVIVIIPSDDYRKKTKRTRKQDFDGTVLVYDENEQYYLLGLQYSNGRLKETLKPVKASRGRLMGQCYKGIYERHDPNGPFRVGGSNNKSRSQSLSEEFDVPSAVDFGDVSYGGDGESWLLVDVQQVSCNQGVPTARPIWQPDSGTLEWFTEEGGSGGGQGTGTGGGGGPDPNTPVPVDEGMPNDLNPVDAFFWSMENRIGGGIYFDGNEKDVIREYPDLIYSISNYVQQDGQKPNGRRVFVLSDTDQQQYPRFTELVRSLPDFVEQHDRVKQALVQHTNLPWNKIKSLLKFGSGPKIVVNELSPASYYGHTIYPAFPEPFIEISARYVRGLEAANLNGTKEATAFLLTVTMLHELTHYGAVDGGRNETRNNEFGDDFERTVLGTTIGKDNAGKLLIDFNKAN